ncbi:hypothetical protein AHMF7605_23985 [Adhaeribacter arboris]|uniref:Peptidase S12 Pab87-related C-terminal domain-containing protein n=1 Tax=Adhaeribacter arboris TaxID=2072846 RepID=A0A2T2YLF3_9BACT|nr:DUF3471 domain-containing protein [Adhaeribacter arboris]PSR56338.1 hypothetical protein AHMF7605_23985 [Adhaeribacter arboris]
MKKLLLLLVWVPFFSFGQTVATKTTAISTSTPQAAIPSETLQKYAGVYELNKDFQVTISVEQDKLFALAPGDQEKSEFTPETNTRYYLKGTPAKIEFIEENGQLYLLVNMQGGLKLKKIS